MLNISWTNRVPNDDRVRKRNLLQEIT